MVLFCALLLDVSLPIPAAHIYNIECPGPFGAIIHVETPQNEECSYQELPCSDLDKEKVAKVITTMAKLGKFALLAEEEKLRRISRDIEQMHPLRFLGCIFSNQKLKECMQEICLDYFKWHAFLDGLIPRLALEASRGKLQCYINEFAEEVGIAPEYLQKYMKSRDWPGLVRFLVSH